MSTNGILLQVITQKPKAYKRLSNYIAKSSGTFSWISRGKTIEHSQKRKNPGDYQTTIDFEKTSNEVVLARIADRKAGITGAFIGLCIRCFGDELIAVNLQTNDSSRPTT
jgi:hypothetical protein